MCSSVIKEEGHYEHRYVFSLTVVKQNDIWVIFTAPYTPRDVLYLASMLFRTVGGIVAGLMNDFCSQPVVICALYVVICAE